MNEERPNNQPSDQELLRRIRAGDREAEFEVDRRWRPRLVGEANRILGDHDLAQEAAQIALWKARLNLERYDNSRPFAPWILRITGNCARDLLRRRQARPVIVGGEMPDPPAGDGADPVMLTARNEELRALRECIDGLGDRSRKVVALRMTGFSLGDTGRMLREPKSTVQGWLQEALVQLRRCMAGKGLAEAC